MRYPPEQTSRNRERILRSAARLFRERGLGGVSVAELMAAAGLTHGGFYRHYPSKSALSAEACRRALDQAAAGIAARHPSGSGLDRWIDDYLTTAHVERCGSGCAVAALGGEVAREPAEVRQAFADGLDRLLAAVAAALPDPAADARRRKAIATLAALAGALTMARAVDDPEFAEEILAAVRAELSARS